jgi:hypothetical protein
MGADMRDMGRRVGKGTMRCEVLARGTVMML